MLKPTSDDFEYLYYGSYYKDDEYCEQLDTKFELVERQFSVDTESAEYVSDSIRVLVVIKNSETGELWGTEESPNSWHEEAWHIADEDIYPVELQQVTRSEYVIVED